MVISDNVDNNDCIPNPTHKKKASEETFPRGEKRWNQSTLPEMNYRSNARYLFSYSTVTIGSRPSGLNKTPRGGERSRARFEMLYVKLVLIFIRFIRARRANVLDMFIITLGEICPIRIRPNYSHRRKRRSQIRASIKPPCKSVLMKKITRSHYLTIL